jgi:hypothetical protein
MTPRTVATYMGIQSDTGQCIILDNGCAPVRNVECG